MTTLCENLFQIGDVLNHKWIILEFIDKGGMGEVYRAHQVKLNRNVAIKVMLKERHQTLDKDIHGNLEAFCRCLNDIDLSGVDRIVNLGDSIGYGPDSEKVLRLLHKCGIPNILGNHELATIDENFRIWLTLRTLKSIERTRKISIIRVAVIYCEPSDLQGG